MIVRDKQSFSIASEKLDIPPLLAPDIAFYIKGLRKPESTRDGVVWLGRNDPESKDSGDVENVDPDVEYIDWIDAPGMPPWVWARRLNKYSRFGLQKYTMGLKERIFLDIAKKRVQRGVEIVTNRRGLVTERLHGHILALLLDLPHVVIDNSYGKISAFHKAWTKDSEIAYFVNSKQDAILKAKNL